MCGVSKCLIEFNKYKSCDNYYIEPKKWGRKSFDKKQFILLKDYEILNNYDYVFIQSIMPKIKNKDNDNLEIWKKILNTIKVKVIFFNHDHNILSIKRNIGIKETCDKAYKIFTLCKNNDFCKYIKTLGDYENKLEVFEPMYNFNKNNWIDFDNKKINYIHWLGRTTSWKRYEDFFLFNKKFNNMVLLMEGLEKSIAFTTIKKLKEKINYNDLIGKKDYVLDKERINLLGPYNNKDMLNRLKYEGFGCQLSALKKKYINMNYEYSHCEMINSGVVCIFNKKWFENCIHRKYKKPFTEINNSGIIWFDKDNIDKCIEEINKVANNKELYITYRNNAFNLWKQHASAEIIFNNIMDIIGCQYCETDDEECDDCNKHIKNN